MRNQLRDIDGTRATFTGTFVRLGQKAGYGGRIEQTVLLQDIRNAEGRLVTDHLWFNLTKALAALGPLVESERLQFDARVKEYAKGYWGERLVDDRPPGYDYKLAWPTRVQRVGEWRSVDSTPTGNQQG